MRAKKYHKTAGSPFPTIEHDAGTNGRQLGKPKAADADLAPQSELHQQIISKASRKEELGRAKLS